MYNNFLMLYCYIADVFGILKGICGDDVAECRKFLFLGGRKEAKQPTMRQACSAEKPLDCGGKYSLIWT